MWFYHMARTDPRAISLENHMKKVPCEGRTPSSNKARKKPYSPTRKVFGPATAARWNLKPLGSITLNSKRVMVIMKIIQKAKNI